MDGMNETLQFNGENVEGWGMLTPTRDCIKKQITFHRILVLQLDNFMDKLGKKFMISLLIVLCPSFLPLSPSKSQGVYQCVDVFFTFTKHNTPMYVMC